MVICLTVLGHSSEVVEKQTKYQRILGEFNLAVKGDMGRDLSFTYCGVNDFPTRNESWFLFVCF